MQKQSGIHFYINIANFNSILLEEEKKTDGVKHALHALDTFFSSIESFGKSNYPKTFVVEKITGSRLHLYVVDDLNAAFLVVKAVSAYAYKLSRYMNTEIPKYKTLGNFYINVGAAYGKFYDFEFTTREGFSELTTIGYAANFAAKLQGLLGYSKIGISEDIFDALPSYEQKLYAQVFSDSIKKYGQDKYYTASLASLPSPRTITEDDMRKAKEYANSINLNEIQFGKVRALLSFQNLSKAQCKELYGIPVFADVRGFTSQFKDDDSNLDEMATRTQEILESMYRVSTQHGGVHVQFQGDRELTLYHNVPEQRVNGLFQAEQKCFKTAVLASMRMVDAVKPARVHIGVGEDFGKLYATKIGARGEKDNILLGDTIIRADIMEDKNAGEDQVAITEAVHEGLRSEDPFLASQFSRIGDCFVATIGYAQYLRAVSYKQQSTNTTQNKYNGAWGVEQ